jgi:hypothetical protein
VLKRLVNDESGVALGLAVVMIVLIGVMGAGLLVFVRNDLEAVVEVNQGQRAADVADAGLHAASQQILGNKLRAHYDVEDASICNTDANDPDDSIDSANDIQRSPSGENWAPAAGQTRDFAGGQFTVTIQWLSPDTTAPVGCRAPKTGTLPDGTEYFRAISTGKHGGAIRKVEAIYETYSLNVPRAYYTPGKINIAGTACIGSVSLFTSNTATDAIDFDGSGGCSGGGHLRGPDLAYGDWNQPPYNTTPRSGPNCSMTRADGTVVTKTCAGVAAVGGVKDSTRLGSLDYASTTCPKFVKDPVNDSSSCATSPTKMTFPFDLASQPDADRLCDEARAQGNYVTDNTTSTTTDFPNAKFPAWPNPSSNHTVVCYEFTNIGNSHTLRWTVSGNETLAAPYDACKGPIRKGTLVIRNGGFSIKSGSNVALFRGVVVTRGPEATQNSEVGDAALTGNNCLDGFINSTGTIKIAGAVIPASSEQANDRPGFYGVRTWSWRELYQ